jgi:hypothetical protein
MMRPLASLIRHGFPLVVAASIALVGCGSSVERRAASSQSSAEQHISSELRSSKAWQLRDITSGTDVTTAPRNGDVSLLFEDGSFTLRSPCSYSPVRVGFDLVGSSLRPTEVASNAAPCNTGDMLLPQSAVDFYDAAFFLVTSHTEATFNGVSLVLTNASGSAAFEPE